MALALLLGYALGSLPFAYWFAGLRGVGPEGLAPFPRFLVLLLELGKGLSAVALGEFLAQDPLGGLLGGVGASWGQAFSPWLLLGKAGGVAPVLGALFAVDPGLLLGFGLIFLALWDWTKNPRPALFGALLSLPLFGGLFWGGVGAGFGLLMALPWAYRLGPLWRGG
ncbi:glycerol-3-phosphate acyltransferase [Thermus sp.]|uniref:glycerol-3-phosphate acyltransferase n=1 Tax=Thermus sp. TaxID=275 RepID=UPI00307FB7CB